MKTTFGNEAADTREEEVAVRREDNQGIAAWMLPSVTDLIFILLLCTLTFGTLSQRLLGDGDIGWHIRNGQHILQTHSIPRTDYLSYTKSGQPWFAWEWLFDIAVGAIDNGTGLNGVLFLSAFLIALVFALAFRICGHRAQHLFVAIVFVLLSLMASSIHFLARPHLLSWFLVVLFWLVLDRYSHHPERRAREVFLLPGMMLAWVNLHGGFVLGLILIGCFFLEACWEWFRARAGERRPPEKNVRQLALVGLLTSAATLVNPYGYRLWGHILEYLTSRFYMNNIQEFLSPNFHGAAEKCFAIILLLVLITLAFNRSRLHPVAILILLFSIYAGLYAARNLPIASLLLTFVTAPMLVANLRRAEEGGSIVSRLVGRFNSLGERMARIEVRSRGHVLPVLTVVILLWIVVHDGRLGQLQIVKAQFSHKRFPIAAVDLLAARQVRSQVFAPDAWGGYLIYRLYPPFQVFVDDRHDFYGEKFLRDYIKVTDIQPGWQEILDRNRVNWVLVRQNSALASALKEVPSWNLTYTDDTAALFTRTVLFK